MINSETTHSSGSVLIMTRRGLNQWKVPVRIRFLFKVIQKNELHQIYALYLKHLFNFKSKVQFYSKSEHCFYELKIKVLHLGAFMLWDLSFLGLIYQKNLRNKMFWFNNPQLFMIFQILPENSNAMHIIFL